MLFEDAKQAWGMYEGSKHKPADFDRFWDQALQDLDALPLDYTLSKCDIASHTADCYDLYFTGIGNARVHCQFVRPRGTPAKPMPVVLQFHGYHSDAGDFSDKIALAAEGMCVLALDARGQGGPSEDTTRSKGGVMKGLIIRGWEEGPEQLYFRAVFLDTAHMARIALAMAGVDAERVAVQGASQGGALALVCAALEPRVSKALVQYPYLSDYRQAFRLNVLTNAYEELAYHFRFRDPLHLREAKFFKTLDYIDLQYLAPRIKAKVVWGIGLEDTVCPPQTQFAVYNQLHTQKTMLAYPEYGHEYLPRYADTTRSFLLCDDERVFA